MKYVVVRNDGQDGNEGHVGAKEVRAGRS